MLIQFFIYYVWLTQSVLKVKQSNYMPQRRLGERRYSPYSLSTSALDGGEWSVSCPGHALAPGKGPQVPTVQDGGWAPESVWTHMLQEKSFASARIESR
jgi:hypothetical protein